MIRVVLVDDQAVVRAGFRVLLEEHGDIAVVGEAAGGREAVAVVARVVRTCGGRPARQLGVEGRCRPAQLRTEVGDPLAGEL